MKLTCNKENEIKILDNVKTNTSIGPVSCFGNTIIVLTGNVSLERGVPPKSVDLLEKFYTQTELWYTLLTV